MTIVMDHGHKIIAAGEFKAKCLAILDAVRRNKETIVVTKRGVPVARISPIPSEAAHPSLEGSVLAEDDIVGPFFDAWESR
jgi:prevent-host-death family protein